MCGNRWQCRGPSRCGNGPEIWWQRPDALRNPQWHSRYRSAFPEAGPFASSAGIGCLCQREVAASCRGNSVRLRPLRARENAASGLAASSPQNMVFPKPDCCGKTAGRDNSAFFGRFGAGRSGTGRPGARGPPTARVFSATRPLHQDPLACLPVSRLRTLFREWRSQRRNLMRRARSATQGRTPPNAGWLVWRRGVPDRGSAADFFPAAFRRLEAEPAPQPGVSAADSAQSEARDPGKNVPQCGLVRLSAGRSSADPISAGPPFRQWKP